jgi:hypothetical protein
MITSTTLRATVINIFIALGWESISRIHPNRRSIPTTESVIKEIFRTLVIVVFDRNKVFYMGI